MARKDDVVSAQLKSGLDDLTAGRLAALDNAVGVHAGLQSLVLNEALRLQAKFGPDDPRAKDIAVRAQANVEKLQQLQVERQATGIQLPEVADDGGLIYGRVVDEDDLGIDRLVVYLVDAAGVRININASTTDATGFFAIVLDPDALARINKASANGVFVAVSTPRGRLLYSQPNPITLTGGMRLLLEIRLRRSDLTATPVQDTTVIVPDVVGKTEQDAFALLKETNLETAKSEKTVTPNQAGRVLAQDPAGGSRVAPGALIKVVIGVAPADTVTVPNLVGATLRAAKAQLKTAELVLGKTSGSNVANTSIVEQQSPAAGTPVAKGSSVDVTVVPRDS
jgi:PASTA domain